MPVVDNGHLLHATKMRSVLMPKIDFFHYNQQLHHQLKELRNQHDIEVMKRCHVIGMTVTGATMRANLLGKRKSFLYIPRF